MMRMLFHQHGSLAPFPSEGVPSAIEQNGPTAEGANQAVRRVRLLSSRNSLVVVRPPLMAGKGLVVVAVAVEWDEKR